MPGCPGAEPHPCSSPSVSLQEELSNNSELIHAYRQHMTEGNTLSNIELYWNSYNSRRDLEIDRVGAGTLKCPVMLVVGDHAPHEDAVVRDSRLPKRVPSPPPQPRGARRPPGEKRRRGIWATDRASGPGSGRPREGMAGGIPASIAGRNGAYERDEGVSHAFSQTASGLGGCVGGGGWVVREWSQRDTQHGNRPFGTARPSPPARSGPMSLRDLPGQRWRSRDDLMEVYNIT
ncbi:uncharacterized protein LOC122548076 [Chiloscyllium plagiosum]|uniref:uncharacterized protein LOC122548076 n=1 Tax=Chiloscyllium plagiosum TaxID=36176 RepID=UPI001CB83876|nr:uncharacterized protein LOC122548076 [Chiloscyllium plagiosum]